MNEESSIPDALQDAFKRFSKLQSEQEKNEFWNELAKSSSEVPHEILNQQLKEGVFNLFEKVNALHRKVKDKITV